MNGPVRAELVMSVPGPAAAEFEREWTRIAHWVQKQPGCLRQALCREPGEDGVFVITSDWTDLLAFRRFESGAAQDERTAPLRRLRGASRMTLRGLLVHLDYCSGSKSPGSADR